MKIRETIARDLRNEPQPTVRVYDDAQLRSDFAEYVLTDDLARNFEKVLAPIVDSARPAAAGTNSVGVWVSGFYGSGKSHLAKIVGHLLADTPIGDETARSLFRALLRTERASHEQLRELLQEAENYDLSATVVPFDIQTEFAPEQARNVGITFLRALYRRLGLSSVIPFAERELELQRAGRYEEFVRVFETETGRSWDDERNMAGSMADVARCLEEVLPARTADEYRDALQFEQRATSGMSITDVVTRLIRWLDGVQGEVGGPHALIFVADEVGNWAGGDSQRIEQVRALVEELGVVGQGRIWLIATAQEKLSDVVQRAPTLDGAPLQDLQQRLEARFRINVHLDPSEVGTVIEERILDKKATARPPLEELWNKHRTQLAGIAQPPQVEAGGNYPLPELENFIRDYPFLPYQIPAAADLFGAMRGPKVSSGARSMIKVVFDAVKGAADEELGRVVSWDRIFDSANSDNEFADERYLGSQGLTYLQSADQHVEGVPLRPSRVLKTLWLVQQSSRIPRTVSNLARLLIDHLETDVSQLEEDLTATLDALAQRNYVRLEPATGQWRFLTQDQVTVERIVQRIADEDVRITDLRQEVAELYSQHLVAQFGGRLTHGRSNTTFNYGVYFADAPLKNEDAPVQLRLYLEGTPTAVSSIERAAAEVDSPVVRWVVPVPDKLEERLKRALAIDRLPTDEELRRVATERTWREVDELRAEADDLRADASRDVTAAVESGTLHYGGRSVQRGGGSKGRGSPSNMKAEVDKALRDRIDARYERFSEGDLVFSPANIDRLIAAAPADRAELDPGTGFFDSAGHLLADRPVLEAVAKYLATTTKNSGNDLIEAFRKPPFGWDADLIRYAVAALFVDGRLVPRAPDGRVLDDPRQRETRALFGTGAFRKARFEIEENPLTAQERQDARTLLTELGAPPTDDGEVALKEAILQLAARLLERSQAVVKAAESGLPLPDVYEQIDPIREELQGQGSRPTLVRALLSRGQELRDIDAALRRMESFVRHNGPAQYRRARDLLAIAVDAGLVEDVEHAADIRSAIEEWGAIEDQRRVLDEWEGRLQAVRGRVVETYRSVYVPLREELASKVTEARTGLTSMEEFEELTPTHRAEVRARYLADGQALSEVPGYVIHDEEQLVRASRQLSIPHMRARLAALDTQVASAKALVLELLGQQGTAEAIVVWDPTEVFSGVQFSTEDEVDMVFDQAREEVKTLVRDGRIVRIL